MKKYIGKKVNRVFALILVVFMIFGMIPTSFFASTTDYPDKYTFNFTCSEENIEGVSFSYSILVNGEEKASDSQQSDENGIIAVDLSEYEESITQKEDVKIKYSATKEGYSKKEEIIDVESVDGSTNVELEKELPDTAEVSVSLEGNATVKINDIEQKSITVEVGQEVKVEIIPDEKNYIKKLTVGDKEKSIIKFEAYTETITVEKDLTITAKVVQEVTLTVNSNDGGSVQVNGDAIKSKAFDYGTEVSVEISANDHYYLSSIVLDGVEQKITDSSKYSDSFTIEKDTIIEVQFVRTYTITVLHNENGTYVSDPATVGGSVTVDEGTNIKIDITPNTNFRIAEVLVNGKADEDIKGDNNESKIYEFAADNDYKFEITFLPNRFNVSSLSGEHGSVSLPSNVVDYGGNITATIVPDVGYTIDSVTVNEQDVKSLLVLNEDQVTLSLPLENIIEDKSINVTFKVNEEVQLSDIQIGAADALRSSLDGKLYVMPKGSSFTLTSLKANTFGPLGVRINRDKKNASSTRVYTITQNVTISYLEIRYDLSWHEVKLNGDITVAFDDVKPTATGEFVTKDTNGYFTQDVDVSIEAKETEKNYSGLKSVEYYVVNNDIEGTPQEKITQKGTLYLYEGQSEILNTYKDNVTVEAAKNNSDNIELHIVTTDRANNSSDEKINLKIITTRPSVSVSMSSQKIHKEALTGYYNCDRMATIYITDRESCIDVNAVYDGIVIYKNGNKISDAEKSKMLSPKSSERGEFIEQIDFISDAGYEWSFSYTNKAGLKNEGIETSGESVYEFTIDKQKPSANIKIDKENIWSKIAEKITFGLFSKDKPVTAVTTAEDKGSGVQKTLYYKSDSETVLSKDELEQLFVGGKFGTEEITVNDDEKFTVYSRITDKAGNTTYVSTNGIIYDDTCGEITLTPDAPNEHGYYNSNVNVDVLVEENVNNVKAYSGIKKVSYVVECVKSTEKGYEETQRGDLYIFDGADYSYKNLKSKYEKNDAIVVDAGKNNSDKVRVTVNVEDNAGNTYSKYIDLSINSTVPSAKIIMDPLSSLNGEYFDKQRTATITINDRMSTFDKESANEGIKISATDSKGRIIESPYSVDEWEHQGNLHTITVHFNKDGNYTWSFNYTNLAGKSVVTDDIDIGKSKNWNKFTVDTNAPTGTVSIDKNSWDKLLSVITFGLYSNSKVQISANIDDETSPYTIEYFTDTKNTRVLSWAELDKQTFVPYEKSFDFDKNTNIIVYLKLTDNAGNYNYICSDGYIVDTSSNDVNITLTPDIPNENNAYNSDVNIGVSVKADSSSSGIKLVQYWIVKDGVKTEPVNIYEFNYVRDEDGDNHELQIKEYGEEVRHEFGALPQKSDIAYEWNGNIVVNSTENNSSNVCVYVKTVDNAGNETVKYTPTLDIDITKPQITVSFDNNIEKNGGYFNKKRTATITINERTNHFTPPAENSLDNEDGIKITAKNEKGDTIESPYIISQWITKEGATPDAAIHTATIEFAKDANYTFNISYSDLAGNKNADVDYTTSVCYDKFTVDTVAPDDCSITASSPSREDPVTWKELVNDLTFGFWAKDKITLSGDFYDITSPIDSVMYYKMQSTNAKDNTKAKTIAELDGITDWKIFNGFTVNANEQFVVYIKITDKAGNYTYISTDGLIVDDQRPIETLTPPEITITPEQTKSGIYNGDVNVDIKVTDPMVGGTYSGLKTVYYKVYNMGVETTPDDNILYTFNTGMPKQSDLMQEFRETITIKSELNNSNDVVVKVFAEDNSKNSSSESCNLKIDTTAPKINISYDNNNVDSGYYFKANRTATVSVTERNFNPDDVKIKITNTMGSVPSISDFVKYDEGSGNKDDTVWVASIPYFAEGDYTFDIAYTDLAGNKCTDINYGNSIQPTKFTIDKILPVMSVTYDNNNSQNGNYYKENRTAKIVIEEHNFDINRVTISLTATDNGSAISTPGITWTNSGDTHTAVISYSTDAKYDFDIDCVDLAGNKANDYAKDSFYIDKTAPKIVITGVANNSANSGDVIPVVTFTDTNFDADKVNISLKGANRDVVAVEGSRSNSSTGQVFTFKNFAKEKEIDDIYSLKATITDKAGNSSDESISFSVNRFGSVYTLSKESAEINGKYIKEPVDIVFTETNPNKISNVKITLFKNNETFVLKNQTDYSISVVGGDGQWYQYVYKIFAKNFADDGTYRISVYSEDEAGNVAENTLDTKKTAINFGVDSTPPTVTVSNLESGKTYAVEKLSVLMSASDNLLLSKVEVYLDDYEKPYVVWNSEDIEEILKQNGEFTFDVPGDSTKSHKVKIVCTDAAGNVLTEEITDFYVTTNILVRFFNNKLLFFGSVGAVLLITGLIIFVVLKKRKKSGSTN